MAFSWSHGAPIPEGEGRKGGLTLAAGGNFSLEVDLVDRQRTLTLYLGVGPSARGRLYLTFTGETALVPEPTLSLGTGQYTVQARLRGVEGPASTSAVLQWAALAPCDHPGPCVLGGGETQRGPVDLSTAGVISWVHWGLGGPHGRDGTAGVVPVANFSTVKGTGVEDYANNPNLFSWSNGAPHQTATTATGVFVAGKGQGFMVNVSLEGLGDEDVTVAFYVGVYQSRTKVAISADDQDDFFSEETLEIPPGARGLVYRVHVPVRLERHSSISFFSTLRRLLG